MMRLIGQPTGAGAQGPRDRLAQPDRRDLRVRSGPRDRKVRCRTQIQPRPRTSASHQSFAACGRLRATRGPS